MMKIGNGLLALLLTISFSTLAHSVEVGDRLPKFSIQTLDGRFLSASTLQGQPALLVFWNTWCSSCRKELPAINALSERFAPHGLRVIGINTGINDNLSKARSYWSEQGFGFPLAFDHDFTVGTAFQVRGVPTIFLIDSQGHVRFKQAHLPDHMDELISAVLP